MVTLFSVGSGQTLNGNSCLSGAPNPTKTGGTVGLAPVEGSNNTHWWVELVNVSSGYYWAFRLNWSENPAKGDKYGYFLNYSNGTVGLTVDLQKGQHEGPYTGGNQDQSSLWNCRYYTDTSNSLVYVIQNVEQSTSGNPSWLAYSSGSFTLINSYNDSSAQWIVALPGVNQKPST